VPEQKSMGLKQAVGGRISDNRAVLVDRRSMTHEATRQSAQILDGKTLARCRLQSSEAQEGENNEDAVNVLTSAK
jgi:hypothetical protein